MLHERFKVFIAIKQQETALHAASRDYGVDGFAHRNSQGSQGAEVPGGLNGNVPSSQIHHIQGSQQFSGHVEITLARKTLKHFGQYEIAGYHWLVPQQGIQPVRLRRRCPSEVVNPHAGINQNHGSVLRASRSPCQFNFPRKRLISSC